MEEELKRQVALFTDSNSLPKIDTRVNIPGSIRKKTLVELLPKEDQSKLEKCFSKIDPETPFLFADICSNAMQDISSVKRVTKEIIEDFFQHNVLYLELLTKLIFKKDKYSKLEYLNAILEEIQDSNLSKKIQTRLIISIDRSSSEISELEEIFDIYTNFKNPDLKKLIVGIDYSGVNNNFKNYDKIIPFFEKVRKEGLKITIQLGETPNYIPFPFDLFVPDRVSHCLFLKKEHIKEIIDKNIPVEICPTYSYKVNHCIYYKDINLKNFWGEENKYKNISLNSDMRSLLMTDISQEYYEIGINFNLGISQLKDIIINSINFIFENDEKIKNDLKATVERFPND